MALALTFHCISRIFLIELSSRFICLHDLYFVALDICFMISLYLYFMLCLIRQLGLEHRYPFHHSNVCSSMMSFHPEGGGSGRDTRVSLINVDIVSGLIKFCWM